MAHLQPVYQNFSVNIDPKEHQKHHGKFALFRWHLPQNTAGLIVMIKGKLNVTTKFKFKDTTADDMYRKTILLD